MTTDTSLATVYALRDAQAATAPQVETPNRFITVLREQFTPTREGLIINGTLSLIAIVLGLIILSVQPTAQSTITTEAPGVYTSAYSSSATNGEVVVYDASEEGGI